MLSVAHLDEHEARHGRPAHRRPLLGEALRRDARVQGPDTAPHQQHGIGV